LLVLTCKTVCGMNGVAKGDSDDGRVFETVAGMFNCLLYER
jgi:hypothetical protein